MFYGRKHEIACSCNKQLSVHKFIELYASATEMCCITEDGVSLVVNCEAGDYVLCSEGGLTLRVRVMCCVARVA
jgi:hypothetical protein